jgi:hypothetical protein
MRVSVRWILLGVFLAILVLPFILVVFAKFTSHRFIYYPVPDSFLEGSEMRGVAERQFIPVDYCWIRDCEQLVRTRDLVLFEYPDLDRKRYLARIVNEFGKGEYEAVVLKDNSTTTETIYLEWIKGRD